MERMIVVTGTAGSGKSVLSGMLRRVIEERGFTAINVNLDPAAKVLPYEPNVDARDFVSYQDYLSQGLGPNAALIASVDSLVLYVDELLKAIGEYKADYVILDTPGQMEVFVYRVGGPMLVRALTGDRPSVNVYLMDALFFEDPVSIASALGLASSVYLRLGLPQINAVSKSDILLPEIIEEIIPRLGEEGFLDSLIEAYEGAPEQAKYIALKTLEALRVAGFIGEIIPVSSLREDTLATLFGMISNIIAGGESVKQ